MSRSELRASRRNGATGIVPGSHAWDRPPASVEELDARGISLEMSAGSVATLPGTLYHRGGANHSTDKRFGMTIQYCQPWLRQLENMMIGVPPELAAQYSEQIQELCGYDLLAGTFVGYVDGWNPKKLVQVAAQLRAQDGS